MIAAGIIGYLIIGGFIAYAMNASFDLGGKADPAASASPSVPKWLILCGIALAWPLAIFAPLVFVWAWISRGSH